MAGSRPEDPDTATFGAIGEWVVIALSELAATDVLAISILSEWIQTAVAYLPAFVAGLLVIVLGFVVADEIGHTTTRTEAATETPYTSWSATGTRLFLYFTAIVIGLDTMGIDGAILSCYRTRGGWGLAAALALGAGIALGWGGHEYVSDNIAAGWDRRNSTVSPEGRPQPATTDQRGRRQSYFVARSGRASVPRRPATASRERSDRSRPIRGHRDRPSTVGPTGRVPQ